MLKPLIPVRPRGAMLLQAPGARVDHLRTGLQRPAGGTLFHPTGEIFVKKLSAKQRSNARAKIRRREEYLENVATCKTPEAARRKFNTKQATARSHRMLAEIGRDPKYENVNTGCGVTTLGRAQWLKAKRKWSEANAA